MVRSSKISINKTINLLESTRDFVDEIRKKTKELSLVKGSTGRRTILLRCVLQRVPLIELALKPPNVAENGSNRAHGTSYDRTDELSEEQSSKLQKRNAGVSTAVAATTHSKDGLHSKQPKLEILFSEGNLSY